MGATLLGRGFAAAGSPEWVRSAEARHRQGGSSRNALLPYAGPLSTSSDLWLVAAGNAHLPVTGNGENVNRLLHATQYATLTVRLADPISLDAMATCGNSQTAQHLEETVRAYATLGAAGTSRQPALSALLRRIRVTRDDRAVHLTLAAPADELQPLLQMF